MKLTLVIPAHNEEQRIGETLDAYALFLRQKIQKKELESFEMLIVINNCRDNTLGVVEKARKKHPEIRYLEYQKGGKGFALVEGFTYALGEFVGFVDADMSTPPESFFDLFQHINGYDGIIASRWMNGSLIKTPQTLLRKITSMGFNFLVRSILFLPYADTQCGAKLFTKKALDSVLPEIGITQWAFDIDLLFRLQRKGFRIKEIPTVWEDKKGSRLNLTKVPLQMFAAIVRLRLIYSPLKGVVRFYDLLPEKIKLHHR